LLAGQARLQLVQSGRDGRFALGDAGNLLGQLLMVVQQ